MFIRIKTNDYLKPTIINCAITSNDFIRNIIYHRNCHTALIAERCMDLNILSYKNIIQITDDEMVVIENISVETSDNGRAVRRVRYHLVETEIFSINNHFRVGY